MAACGNVPLVMVGDQVPARHIYVFHPAEPRSDYGQVSSHLADDFLGMVAAKRSDAVAGEENGANRIHDHNGIRRGLEDAGEQCGREHTVRPGRNDTHDTATSRPSQLRRRSLGQPGKKGRSRTRREASSGLGRQPDREAGAAGAVGTVGEGAAVRAHHGIADREAEASPFRLGGEERIEHALEDLW